MSIALATDGYYGGSGGIGGGDTDPPVITPVDPQPATAPGDVDGFSPDFTVASVTPIRIAVTDVFPGLSVVYVSMAAGDESRAVFRAGSFVGEFIADSAATPITDGVELSILPDAGWPPESDATQPSFVTLTIDAVDLAGNLASSDLVWQLPPAAMARPAPGHAPVVGVDHVADALKRLISQFRG